MVWMVRMAYRGMWRHHGTDGGGVTVHAWMTELRGCCCMWVRFRHGEAGHGATRNRVPVVRTAQHIEAAHARMVHLAKEK